MDPGQIRTQGVCLQSIRNPWRQSLGEYESIQGISIAFGRKGRTVVPVRITYRRTTVCNSPRELVDRAGLVSSSESEDVVVAIYGNVLHMPGLELLHGCFNVLDATLLTPREMMSVIFLENYVTEPGSWDSALTGVTHISFVEKLLCSPAPFQSPGMGLG